MVVKRTSASRGTNRRLSRMTLRAASAAAAAAVLMTVAGCVPASPNATIEATLATNACLPESSNGNVTCVIAELHGVTVELMQGDKVLDSTTSAAGGRVSFKVSSGGEYTLRATFGTLTARADVDATVGKTSQADLSFEDSAWFK